MRIAIPTICACLLFSVTFSQTPPPSVWKKLESNTFVRLHGVHFLDAQHGWVAGSRGTLMETRDGGATWQRQPLNPKESEELVRDLWVFHDERPLLLGEYNLGLHPSTDMVFNRTFLLTRSDMLPDRWQHIGGARPLNPPRRTPRRKLPEINPRTDNEVDDEEVERLTDPVLVRFHFADASHGWSVGESGTIERTDNGGLAWKMQYAIPRKLLYDVYALDARQAWIVGATGTIIRTTDAGESWQDVPAPTTQTLRAVHFTDARHGWAVGVGGVMLKATAGDRVNKANQLVVTWEALPSPTQETLNDVFFVSPLEGWVCGEHATMLHTRDGGQTWDDALASVQVRPYVTFNRLYFLDAHLGWVVGSNGLIYGYSNAPSGVRPDAKER